MADQFGIFPVTLDSPIIDSFAIAANDTITFAQPTRALYVGQSGNVNIMHYNKANTMTNAVFENVQSGTLLPIRTLRVYNTNTTAGGLRGCY
jgi:hypothetical protein